MALFSPVLLSSADMGAGCSGLDGHPCHSFSCLQTTQGEAEATVADMVCHFTLVKSVSQTCSRLFDVSKQVVGQMFVHGVNLLMSNRVAHRKSSNACVAYILNILLDTTLGMSSTSSSSTLV